MLRNVCCKFRIFAPLLLFALLLAGCRMPQYVPFPDQSMKVEDSSKARIYVIRPPMYWGSAVKMKIYDGNEYIGKTKAGSYLCWERDPGEAVISGKASNRDELPIFCEAGEVYYVGQVVTPGVPFASNQLKIMREHDARKRLKACRAPKER